MNIEPYTPSSLTNHRTALQRIVDPLNTIILHANQEAARHLRVRCPGIE